MDPEDQSSNEEIDEILKQMRSELGQAEEAKPKTDGTVDDVTDENLLRELDDSENTSTFDNILIEDDSDESEEAGEAAVLEDIEEVEDEAEETDDIGGMLEEDDEPPADEPLAEFAEKQEPQAPAAEKEPAAVVMAEEAPRVKPAARRKAEVVPAVAAKAQTEAPAAVASVAPSVRSEALTKTALIIGGFIALNAIAIFTLAAAIYWSQPGQPPLESITAAFSGMIQQAEPAALQPEANERSEFEIAVEEVRRLHEEGRHEETLAFYSQSLAGAPDRPDVLWMVSTSAFQLEHYGEAARLLGRLVDNFPGDRNFYEAHFNKGLCYQRLGHHPQAVKVFYRLLALSGGMTATRQQMLPIIYQHIADSHRLDVTGRGQNEMN